jgi:uncharacterized protein (DUF362 family)
MDKQSIYVIYGNSPREMVPGLLKHAGILKELDKTVHIGIKPNLVVAKPHTSGATTSPELVAAVIEYLQKEGFVNITILEGSWVGGSTERAYKVCGYEKLSKEYGIPLVDLQKDSSFEYDTGEMKLKICNSIKTIDFLINIPVLKGHCQTKMTCALKNLKGCIPDSEKRRFHTMGLHKPIAHLNLAIKSSVVIIDGLMGDLNFEEGGESC